MPLLVPLKGTFTLLKSWTGAKPFRLPTSRPKAVPIGNVIASDSLLYNGNFSELYPLLEKEKMAFIFTKIRTQDNEESGELAPKIYIA